ncbi:FxsA family protein [Actinobacillus seminis]|uniref:FxsA family protein n=1 Tax=Actinobacillus seminis TaxID=722 RepID=UPI003B94CD30
MPLLILCLIAFTFIYAELSIIVWFGSALGIINVILLLVLSSFFGLFLIRTRGWYTLFNVRQQLAQGELLTVSLLKSGCRIFAGILFFIPGFLTDILALLLLSPVGSGLVQRFISKKTGAFRSKFLFKTHRTYYSNYTGQSQNSEIFEAEFERRVDEDKRVK